MRLGRRPLFFLGVSITFLALLVPTPEEFRRVNLVMAGLAAFWFVLLAIEEVSGRGGGTDEGGRA
ncbi:MAG: hypothetical protein HY240_00470 [Actinobacteria bacterium]|nr:hypothetical protein [Actinomycetota bacterium]